MTGLTYDAYLALMATGLMFAGGALAWPIARRIGERRPDPMLWVPVQTSAGRAWRRATPPPPPLLRRWRATLGTRAMVAAARARAWWDSTAPRDVHAPVRAALSARAGTPPPWLASDFIGRPPAGMA